MFVGDPAKVSAAGGRRVNKQFGELFVAKVANELCSEPARSDLEPLGYFSKLLNKNKY